MKIYNIKSKLTFIVLFLSFINSYAQISKAEIIATGLTCSMCSNAINKQLKALPEVEKVMIDLNTNTFIVAVKKGSVISPEQLKNNIEKTGFFVGSMILTLDNNPKLQDDGSFKNASGTYILVSPKARTTNGNLRLKVLNNGFVTKKEYKQSAKLLAKYKDVSSQQGTYLVKVI